MMRHLSTGLLLLTIVLLGRHTVAAMQDAELRAASEAAAAGRWAEVLKTTTPLVRKHPKHVGGSVLHAMALLQTGRFGDAAREGRRALTLDSTVAQAYLVTAEALLRTDSTKASLTLLDKARTTLPNDLAIPTATGMTLARLGRHHEAVVPLEDVLFRRPDNSVVLRQLAQSYRAIGRVHEATGLLEQALNVDATDRVARHALAECYYATARYADAGRTYRSLLTDDPADANARHALAVVLSSQGQYQDAVVEFREALRRQADNAELWYNYGTALRFVQQTDSAYRAFRRAVALAPTMAPAWLNLGLSQEQLGRTDDGLKSFAKAAELDTSLAALAYDHSATALRAAGRFDEAVTFHERALRQRASEAMIVVSYSHTLFAAKRHEAGITLIQTALQRFPDNPDLLHVLARHYIRLGRMDDAESIRQRIASIRPLLAEDLRSMMKY